MDDHSLRLRKIERWARWLSWYYLVTGILGIFSMIYTSIFVFVDPESMGLIGGMNDIWIKLIQVFGNIRSLLVTLFIFLFLQGISRMIRYLLATKGKISSKAEAIHQA